MNKPKPTVLIIGITGSFGGAVARELTTRGYALRALVRDTDRAAASVARWPGESASVELVQGDALHAPDLVAALQGMDALVYGFNAPYDRWDPLVEQAAEVAFSAAEKAGATVIFPGNVYGLGVGTDLSESSPLKAMSRKGKTRNRVEERLSKACTQGARAIVVRAGDFFGPLAPQATSWFSQLTGKAVRGKSAITYGGPDGVQHAFAYLPDVARVAVSLYERRAELQPYEVFHFSGQVVDRGAFVDGVRKAIGAADRKAKTMPWGLIGLLRPFSKMVRELWEMRYLWEQEVLLADDKLRKLLGPVAAPTPFDIAAAETVSAMTGR